MRYQRRDEWREEWDQYLAVTVLLAKYGRRDKRTRLRAAAVAQLEALNKRAHAQLQRADIADVVDLQQSETLAVSAQQIAHLVRKQCIGSATERGHLHELHIAALTHTPLRRTQDTVRVGPLRDEVRVADFDLFVTYDVVRNDIHTHRGDHIREFVLYERIGMVWTSRKYYCQTSCRTARSHDILIRRLHPPCKRSVFIQRKTESLDGSFAVYAQRTQIIYALAAQQLLREERYRRSVERYGELLDAAHDIRISRHDRAVVAVDGLAVLRTLVYDIRHEYAVDTLRCECSYMAVHQLGREADVVRHDLAHVVLVCGHVRRLREYDTYATIIQ